MKQVFYVYKDKKTGKYLAVDSEDSSDDFFYTDSIFLTDDFEKAYKAKDLTSNKVDKILTYRSDFCTIGKEIWNEFGNDPSDKFYPDDLEIVIETYLIQLINVI